MFDSICREISAETCKACECGVRTVPEVSLLRHSTDSTASAEVVKGSPTPCGVQPLYKF
jgi:hypothetical protein